jgi:osmotically-inducible protein OsmY
VRNYLKLDPIGPPTVAEIEVNARAALARDVVVHDEPIDVSVRNGVARLEGKVASWFAREQAEEIIARVNGVTDIENLLDVESTVPAWSCSHYDWDPVLHDVGFDYQTVRVKPDWEIRDDIESELRWSPCVDHGDIGVAVEDATATLTGQVDSYHERSLATDNAIEGGAAKVLNQLRVSAFGGSS